MMRSVHVDPMRACSWTPVVVDFIPIDQDPGTISENPVSARMVNPIVSYCAIVKILEFHSSMAVPYLKPLNCDPTNRILRT